MTVPVESKKLAAQAPGNSEGESKFERQKQGIRVSCTIAPIKDSDHDRTQAVAARAFTKLFTASLAPSGEDEMAPCSEQTSARSRAASSLSVLETTSTGIC